MKRHLLILCGNLLGLAGFCQNTFPSSGNVGIGTSYPGAILETNVSGSARMDGGLARFLQPNLYDGGDNAILIGKAADVNKSAFFGYSYNSAGSLIYLSHYGDDGATAGIILRKGGNVGIGVLYPNDKLAVNGNIRARKVIVTQSGWADYVFDPTYDLRPLDQLETYLKLNHHLPEVPSAKEVAENGDDLGETQKLLLKKIEELTLYVIQLKKENTELGKRITQLETKK